MAALSDPGGFSKAAEQQNETMKGLGIEQTDAKAEAKKKKEEEAKRGNKVIYKIRLHLLFSSYIGLKKNDIKLNYKRTIRKLYQTCVIFIIQFQRN